MIIHVHPVWTKGYSKNTSCCSSKTRSAKSNQYILSKLNLLVYWWRYILCMLFFPPQKYRFISFLSTFFHPLSNDVLLCCSFGLWGVEERWLWIGTISPHYCVGRQKLALMSELCTLLITKLPIPFHNHSGSTAIRLFNTSQAHIDSMFCFFVSGGSARWGDFSRVRLTVGVIVCGVLLSQPIAYGRVDLYSKGLSPPFFRSHTTSIPVSVFSALADFWAGRLH